MTLDIDDVEHAILTGHLARIERDDPRGTRYVVEGTALNEVTNVGVVGRFTTTDRLLIIRGCLNIIGTALSGSLCSALRHFRGYQRDRARQEAV